MKYLIFIFIFVLLIIIIINNNNCTDNINLLSYTNSNNNSLTSYDKLLPFINGYWISNDEFNTASDIDKMILYIDYFSNNAKLVIISDNKLIVKDEYQIYIDEENINIKNLVLENIKISFISKENTVWANKEFKCILNINSGNIKLIDNKTNTVFGDLFKDNIISNFINSI